RSLVDTAVWSPERLDFIGGAACGPGVVQKRGEPAFWNADRCARLTIDRVGPLSEMERAQFEEVTTAIRAAAEPEARRTHARWLEERQAAGHRVAVTRMTSVEQQRASGPQSLPNGAVAFLDGEHPIRLADGTWVSIDEILAN